MKHCGNNTTEVMVPFIYQLETVPGDKLESTLSVSRKRDFRAKFKCKMLQLNPPSDCSDRAYSNDTKSHVVLFLLS